MSFLTRVDANDYFWTYFGDLYIEDDDILDTFTVSAERDVPMISLRDIIITRIESESDEWMLHPELNLNLRNLIGTTTDVNRVISEGVAGITRLLTFDGLLKPGDFSIYPIRYSLTAVLFVVIVNASSGKIQVTFSYDLNNNLFRNMR